MLTATVDEGGGGDVSGAFSSVVSLALIAVTADEVGDETLEEFDTEDLRDLLLHNNSRIQDQREKLRDSLYSQR